MRIRNRSSGTRSADEILASIARFAQRTHDFQAAPLIQRTTVRTLSARARFPKRRASKPAHAPPGVHQVVEPGVGAEPGEDDGGDRRGEEQLEPSRHGARLRYRGCQVGNAPARRPTAVFDEMSGWVSGTESATTTSSATLDVGRVDANTSKGRSGSRVTTHFRSSIHYRTSMASKYFGTVTTDLGDAAFTSARND